MEALRQRLSRLTLYTILARSCWSLASRKKLFNVSKRLTLSVLHSYIPPIWFDWQCIYFLLHYYQRIQVSSFMYNVPRLWLRMAECCVQVWLRKPSPVTEHGNWQSDDKNDSAREKVHFFRWILAKLPTFFFWVPCTHSLSKGDNVTKASDATEKNSKAVFGDKVGYSTFSSSHPLLQAVAGRHSSKKLILCRGSSEGSNKGNDWALHRKGYNIPSLTRPVQDEAANTDSRNDNKLVYLTAKNALVHAVRYYRNVLALVPKRKDAKPSKTSNGDKKDICSDRVFLVDVEAAVSAHCNHPPSTSHREDLSKPLLGPGGLHKLSLGSGPAAPQVPLIRCCALKKREKNVNFYCTLPPPIISELFTRYIWHQFHALSYTDCKVIQLQDD